MIERQPPDTVHAGPEAGPDGGAAGDAPAGPAGEVARLDPPVRPFVHQATARSGQVPALAEHAIRPYLVTSGRTRGAAEIPLEAQVVITALGESALESLTFEYRDVVAACVEPLAVAELAARLKLHLGVARVLIGDLHHQGLIDARAPGLDLADDVETIERMMDVLRARS